jgi:opacity protein-like surface antigen
MKGPFASSRHWRGLVAACLISSLLALALSPTALAGPLADGDGAVPPQASVDPAESAPRWTFSAEAIGLARQGGVNQTLIARVPGDVPFYSASGFDSATYPGAEALNSDQFRQGFAAGPKLNLTYHDPSGYGAELSYFSVVGLSAAKAVGPDNPADWLVMKAPGTFWQTQDFPYQAMAWTDATSLFSAEANGRLDLSSRVTVLAGLRWLQLNDSLQGTMTPADRTAPMWKGPCSGYSLVELSSSPTTCADYPGGSPKIYAPFWTTSVTNNLFGVQVGLEGKLLELGRLSLDGTVKAGLFDDSAEQSTVVSMRKTLLPPSRAATNHAAFAGEAGLQVKYQLTKGLAVKAGYEALWLSGVALAPGQIQETSTTPDSATALGVNCRSSALFQGGTVGLEFSF